MTELPGRDLRYPADALRGDHLRALAGLALTAGPFLLTTPHPLLAVPLALAAALFAAYEARTLLRQATTYRLDVEGIAARGPFGKPIKWAELSDVKLDYYSTRKDRKEGWMQLTLTGGGKRLALESSLDGFDRVAALAAEAATENRLRLSERTRDNFVSLGHVVPDPDQTPASIFGRGKR
ncbi:MAG TPA: hypothetical protein VED40_21570 [Azospirillaceae bacterium]|nr:hypothetical protein [Azospirillaceae bacterium]